MKIESKTISCIEDFKRLKSIWTELDDGNEMTAFQSYDWNYLLVEEFFSDFYNTHLSELKVYYCTENDIPTLILPAIIQKHTFKISWFGRRKGVYILGINSYSDYINCIYKDFSTTAFQSLINYIKLDTGGLPININFLREDTSLYAFLKAKGINETRTSKSAFIDIADSVDDYNGTLSKNTKQNLRTALNRMNKDKMDYKLQCCEHIDNENDIDQMIKLHRERLDQKVRKEDVDKIHLISRILRNDNKKRIEKKYDIVKNSMQKMESSYYVIVRLDGIIAGYLYGLRDRRAYRIMHNCFDEQYKFYSPMFRGAYDFILNQIECRSLNVKQIDFTRGDEEYKFKLGAQELLLHHYII